MNRTLALAALLAATPAFAQTSTLQAQSSSTTQSQVAKEQAETSVGTSSSLGAPPGTSAGALVGAPPVCTPSATGLTDCVAEPASGVRNPVVTNSLDATGTFSTAPAIVTPLNEGADARNMGGASASGTPKKP
jgi:hypothetical protein